MRQHAQRSRTLRRSALSITATIALTGGLFLPSAAHGATTTLPVDDAFRTADIGFHDLTRDGTERPIRNDLTGTLGGMVELVQSSTSLPTNNSAAELPDPVAERTTLLLFTPTSNVSAVLVEARIGDTVLGTVPLATPGNLPASDQTYDARGTVAYSLRAWSVALPVSWMRPGLQLSFADLDGRSGELDAIDIGAPTELVINNIRLGMLTDAPVSNEHRFITDPASGATDYFQTLPISRLTVAQYETVNLDQVIVGSGDIYTLDSPDPSTGSVYSGTMRENVGKAQVSTGINLATFGITSSPMNQQQPGLTNQRVIHHSAGLYSNGSVTHGLSGGNGMATLFESVGNELSHELGHSFGLGHYPGWNSSATGDDVVRNASHHMDSGWGYIAYRELMRSNLATGAFQESVDINGHPFSENLAGAYNFNTDAMSGGWDASPVSDYTHHSGYSQARIQDALSTIVADTAYPSGYRDWDQASGTWVDARTLNPQFAFAKPTAVGVPVFTILGGYNPANADQTLVYPAFRSNYGVVFDLPQADASANSSERACWLQVDFANAPTQHITLNASDGVKQLNVNIAESESPTAAQVHCRVNGVTTALGNTIEIATNQEPMAPPVVVGQEAGFETLRAQELAALQPVLENLESDTHPVLTPQQLMVLRGWSDDLSLLSERASAVATRALELQDAAADVTAYLAEHGSEDTAANDVLRAYLNENGYLNDDGTVVSEGGTVTVENGRCLYIEDGAVKVDPAANQCSTQHADRWLIDLHGRIHAADTPELCLAQASPVQLEPCAVGSSNQRWTIAEDGFGSFKVVRADDPSQAMDYFRHEGHPGMWDYHGSSNQRWQGFVADENPLLGQLDGATIALLHEAVGA